MPLHQIDFQYSLLGVHFLYSCFLLLLWPSRQPCSSCSSSTSRLFRPRVNDNASWGDVRNIEEQLYLQAFLYSFLSFFFLSFSLSVEREIGPRFGFGSGSCYSGRAIVTKYSRLSTSLAWLAASRLHSPYWLTMQKSNFIIQVVFSFYRFSVITIPGLWN